MRLISGRNYRQYNFWKRFGKSQGGYNTLDHTSIFGHTTPIYEAHIRRELYTVRKICVNKFWKNGTKNRKGVL